MMRTTKRRNTLFKHSNHAAEKPQQSFLAQKSKKRNFDHLNLRDQSNMIYKKINGIIRSKGESIYSKMVFSDYMYKFNAYMDKSRVIVLITDCSIYVMSLKNYSVINHTKLNEIESILSI